MIISNRRSPVNYEIENSHYRYGRTELYGEEEDEQNDEDHYLGCFGGLTD